MSSRAWVFWGSHNDKEGSLRMSSLVDGAPQKHDMLQSIAKQRKDEQNLAGAGNCELSFSL
jgi:hypothetical protein